MASLLQLAPSVLSQLVPPLPDVSDIPAAPVSIPNTLMQSDKERPPAAAIAPWVRASESLAITFMDDCAAEDYLEDAWGSRFVKAFQSLRSGAIKCDFLRLAYIADRGGFYADTDSCAADVSLETLRQRAIEHRASLIITESYWKPDDKRFNFNGFFAAQPKHPALMKLAHAALDNVEKRLGANHSAKSPMPEFCDCSSGCCAMAIAGPGLMASLFKEPNTIVLSEVARGEVSDPESNRTVLTKCKQAAAKTIVQDGHLSQWEREFESNQIYWPEGFKPVSACEVPEKRKAAEERADALKMASQPLAYEAWRSWRSRRKPLSREEGFSQKMSAAPQLMIMYAGSFIYEPFVRTLAEGVAGLPSAARWNVVIKTLTNRVVADDGNAGACVDPHTSKVIMKHYSALKAGDVFVFVGPYCANHVPWREMKSWYPRVHNVFWQVEPNAWLSHNCEFYFGFNSPTAWFSKPSDHPCSWCVGKRFPTDAGKMILLNKRSVAADLINDPETKMRKVKMNEAVHSARRAAAAHRHRTTKQSVANHDPVISNTSDWYVDEMWEYSRQSFDACAEEYRPSISRHVPVAALAEETSDGAETTKREPERRAAPLRKAIFFGDTRFGDRSTCWKLLEKEMEGTGLQLIHSLSVNDWQAWKEAVTDPSAVFINIHKNCLDRSSKRRIPRWMRSNAYLGENVFGIALEPRVALLLGNGGLVVSQHAHPDDVEPFQGLVNFTTLMGIPKVIKELQAMPDAERHRMSIDRKKAFRKFFNPAVVLKTAKVDRLLSERLRMHDDTKMDADAQANRARWIRATKAHTAPMGTVLKAEEDLAEWGLYMEARSSEF